VTVPTAPNESAVARQRFRRRVALAAILALVAIVALLTPEIIGGRSGDPRLSTFSANPQGARLLFELARRLGWQTERSTTPAVSPVDERTVVAVFDPLEPLGAIATHELLDQVRAGSGLLYVMSGSSPLNDSLHLRRSIFGGEYQPTAAGTAESPSESPVDSLRARRFDSASSDPDSADDEEPEASRECAQLPPNGGALSMWPDQKVQLYRMQFLRAQPPGTVIFARAVPDTRSRDSARAATVAGAGFAFGRGRVVVLSDADFLRNDVLRVCRFGLDVVAVRVLEYLADGAVRRDRLVFDEYHQGYGAHPGTLRAIGEYLSRSSSGHVLLQCMLAGLVLLLAVGPRALPAHDPERAERRSPLEHVSALARAYARVGGTRTATARLLRGLRRRVDRAAPTDSGRSAEARDRQFLESVESIPALASDAGLIRRALAEPLTGREFTVVGAALARVEHTLLTTPR